MSALPSLVAAWASAHVPMYLFSSGTLIFLATASTSEGAAPTMLSPSLKAITGYCGWPVAVILVQVSSAKAALQVSVKAANTLKRRSLFIVGGSLFLVERSAGTASYCVFAGSARPFDCALILSTCACVIFPALTSAPTHAGDKPGPALRMQRF